MCPKLGQPLSKVWTLICRDKILILRFPLSHSIFLCLFVSPFFSPAYSFTPSIVLHKDFTFLNLSFTLSINPSLFPLCFFLLFFFLSLCKMVIYCLLSRVPITILKFNLHFWTLKLRVWTPKLSFYSQFPLFYIQITLLVSFSYIMSLPRTI